MGLIVEAAYPTAGALRAEIETQLGLGGLILETAPPATLSAGAVVELRLVAVLEGQPQSVTVAAVVTDRSDVELCLELEEAMVAVLRGCPFSAAPQAAAASPKVRFLEAEADPPLQPVIAERIEPIERRLAAMSVGEKIQMALHGDRQWRALLSRDRAGVIQSALIRNPRVSIDELTALARGPALAPDAAEAMAQHPSFGSSPQIALALVRNPRTPLPTATTMVGRLSPTDLRTIAKGLGVRAQIAGAARKRLLGP